MSNFLYPNTDPTSLGSVIQPGNQSSNYYISLTQANSSTTVPTDSQPLETKTYFVNSSGTDIAKTTLATYKIITTSQTVNKPNDVKHYRAILIGGGGGSGGNGGTSNSSGYRNSTKGVVGGSGGNGGYGTVSYINKTPWNETLTITIGSGGNSGTDGANDHCAVNYNSCHAAGQPGNSGNSGNSTTLTQGNSPPITAPGGNGGNGGNGATSKANAYNCKWDLKCSGGNTSSTQGTPGNAGNQDLSAYNSSFSQNYDNSAIQNNYGNPDQPGVVQLIYLYEN
jgi:hypothetical protein